MTRLRFLARGAAVAAIWVGAEAAVWACPVCFQIEDSPISSGVRAAVLVLIGITSGVLVAFGRFAWRMARAEASSPKTQASSPV